MGALHNLISFGKKCAGSPKKVRFFRICSMSQYNRLIALGMVMRLRPVRERQSILLHLLYFQLVHRLEPCPVFIEGDDGLGGAFIAKFRSVLEYH
jgi:hypothetical protein